MSEALKQAAVAAAVAASSTVNTRVKTDLTSDQVRDIAANMPPAAAMESLLPQLGHQLLVVVGGVVATKGWLSSSDVQLYSGAIIAIAPIVYRIATTLLARRGIKF